MNLGIVLGASFGEAVVAALVAYPIVYGIMAYAFNIRYRRSRVIVTFVLSVLALSAIVLTVNLATPTRVWSPSSQPLDWFLIVVLPLVVTFLVLYGALGWLTAEPTAKPQNVAAPRLDTPAKRIAFLVMLAALGVAIATATYVSLFERFNIIKAFDYSYNYWGYKSVFLGALVVSVVAAVVAFFYEPTVGRVTSWVRTGK